MSGPYRFNQESAKSPLDRTTSPFSAGQPVSYKTNVNRAKTKKWVTAKKNAYDGDDWGDYDEYDEYGVDQEPPPSAPAQSQRYYAGGQPQRTNTDRSFTEPVHQGPPGKARRNSFEAGEEHRAFSASIPPPQSGSGQQYGEPEPQNRRDFTPSAMPPPLQTQISSMPSDINASPARTHFPPRKSSIGQADSPVVTSPRSPVVTSPRSRAGSHSDKPLPFVRPADIYKRVEEERERERASLDSSRPSLDSLTSRPKDDLHSPTSDGGRMLQPLETVAERKSEYLPNFDSAFTQGEPPASSSVPSQTPGNHMPAVAPPNDQGFRSVVDQAFTRTDDQNSIPPTPISKDPESDMTRTNTGSTVGISPIMSRVPSAATSAMKRNQAGEGSTPVITEEPSDTAATVAPPTSYFPHDGRAAATKPFTDHARNLSSSSIPRSGLATPTRGDSPARSPVIAPQKDLPKPETAQVAKDSLEQTQNMDGGLSGPSPAYATREADIATVAKTSPESAAFGLGAAEKQSQDAFLDSHVAQSPIEDALPRSRSESPSKGRVQVLAGKFGDVASSRRGSTQSNMSRNSVQSWEKSQDNSRAPSPTKGSPSKPSSPTKEFRPHLPGQWESYATTVATPMDHSERNRSLDFGKDNASTSLENADLTPTTAKRPVDGVSSNDMATDPLVTLRNAGAAMAQSIKATVGIDDASSQAESEEQRKKDTSHGDKYMPRPLQLERNASSFSSIPPTPPAKDTPADERPPHLPTKDVDTDASIHQKRPDFFPQLSTQPSADDEESDRLRKEIVASLTPVASTDPSRASLQPGSPMTNRASSILPAEYDSYWADGDEHDTARQSHDADRSIPAATPTAAVPEVSPTGELPKTSLLNRFSWEDNTSRLASSENAASNSTLREPTNPAPQDIVPPASVEQAVEEERKQWSGGPQDPYFGPGHTLTVTKPDPVTDPEPPARSSTSPINHDSLASPTREHTRSPGLHVVNSAEDPEAVDLPPRLSAEHSASVPVAQGDAKASQQEADHEAPNATVTTTILAPEPTSSEHVQANTHELSPTSPTSGKPLGAREIATINSTAERIATYNSTRQHWATHDHGLEDWLTSAMSANPDLASQTVPVQRTSTGTVRHKHTASLSLLGKFGSASTYQLPGGEHNTSTSTQAPAGVDSPTSGASPASGAAFDRRVASRQLEAKGKDLLHTANVLSGKGLTSAKGLFAKGKSRFGREKVEK
ncbi:hypothetical protein DE146DRAFT_754030 [Phaeosphaeria sp. MPI-PUGE-AT-0046c]|nr:hypothetical protein DE146DRAFT_754030 [Phaeosphaeria sp. MPI-PUGE-AT-0046c]